jgi:hypothetical protein
MAQHEENERPRPHGDPLRENVEDNAAQRQSDSPGPDSTSIPGERVGDFTEASDRAGGRGSSANGVPAFDEDGGAERKRQYEENGAGLVSRID